MSTENALRQVGGRLLVRSNRFRKRGGEAYCPCCRVWPERLDVTDLQFADGEFDAVMCNHVLEHVPDDRRAMSEIRRVMRPGAWALLLVPEVEHPTTSETPDITDPEELFRLYGQRDHVRVYGWDYLDRLREAGLETEVLRLREVLTDETIHACRLLKFGEVEPIFLARAAAGSGRTGGAGLGATAPAPGATQRR